MAASPALYGICTAALDHDRLMATSVPRVQGVGTAAPSARHRDDVGHLVATLLGRDPKHELDADLMRMKSFIETGRLPQDAGLSQPWRPGDASPEMRSGAALH
jgi:hypothetical protein